MIRLDELPVGERFDFWWEAVAQAVVSVDASSPEAGSFWAEMHVVDLGIAQLSRVRCTSFEAQRTRRRIRQSDPGLYQLSLTLQGRSGMQQQGREADLGPADLLLYDTSRPFRAWTMAGGAPGARAPHGHPGGHGHSGGLADGLILQFPREVLPVPSAEVERLLAVRLPGQEGVGALLSGLLLQLVRQRDPLTPQEAVRVSTVILDLLATLLTRDLGTRPTASPNDPRRLLLMRVQEFIERNLGDVDLSPSLIASCHHVSTRHLQRLFEEQGLSVACWIRQRRLERCRRDLADPAQYDLPVHTVAARWGFSSESHFNRVFRTAYGMPPATYRRSLRESADADTAC
ncbi:AraC-like DNA-binding protein [Streptosporangium album]|uniref:AraC-like DNA-binding protein n=1 Tax=Streptosporangium album TaxID=47479 RepID=A0A7W7S0F1_9ACTN|nr:helix-turn-helix domain-containing protein [Streptosporangium album]MBB4941598.1 AraC-like DNA-binding protein [Streptosporangium album]